jgi:hypothetical protein
MTPQHLLLLVRHDLTPLPRVFFKVQLSDEVGRLGCSSELAACARRPARRALKCYQHTQGDTGKPVNTYSTQLGATQDEDGADDDDATDVGSENLENKAFLMEGDRKPYMLLQGATTLRRADHTASVFGRDALSRAEFFVLSNKGAKSASELMK